MDSFIVCRRLMKRAAVIFCWISVILAGAYLRFDDLASRPFHADEATGAKITAMRMESTGGRFDPKHFHGPLLADLAAAVCRLNGEDTWRELTKFSLRILPAIAGTMLLLVPLLWRKRGGDAPMLLATAFMATSPLLVYYSRMFIHEPLLVLFGMAALLTLVSWPRWGVPGILTGLMFATKETFAISMIAWTGAGLLVAFENRESLNRMALSKAWRQYRMPVIASILTATLTASAFYTDGFRHPGGIIDAVRTFFVYETVSGHDKPFVYYLHLLAVPVKSGGLWWFGTPLLVLGMISYASTFRRLGGPMKHRSLIRFIAYAAAGHLLIYSLVSYKTPWLACLPWAHVCLLAGMCVVDFPRRVPPMKACLVCLAALCIVTQVVQSRRATGRFASDERNPMAYVPTRPDIETLGPWLDQLRGVAPNGSLEPVAVIGKDYWPLPWYLRSFEKIGYWSVPPEGLETYPLVFVLPESEDRVTAQLEKSHVPLPRGLRAGVPVQLFLRSDIWKRWMNNDSR